MLGAGVATDEIVFVRDDASSCATLPRLGSAPFCRPTSRTLFARKVSLQRDFVVERLIGRK